MRGLVSLFWALAFGRRNLFPGRYFGDVEDVGRSPRGGDKEESEKEGSAGEGDDEQSGVIGDNLEEEGVE